MVSFCKRTLRNLTNKIGSGATPTGGDASYKTHGISLIRSQNVLDYFFSKDGLAFIDEKQAKELNNVTLQDYDVLVNITGDSVARVCQVPIDLLPARVNQHVAILRANTEKLIPAYLKYYLLNKPNKERLLSLASTGATRKALTKGMLEEFEIEIPDEEGTATQTRIASILSALDDKIELNRRTNHTLEQMAQTLFKKYFVDDIDPDNLPKEWSIKPLDEIAKFLNGLPLQKYRPVDENNFIPVIKIREMKNGISNNTEKADPNLPSQFIIDDGDILFSWSGTLEVEIWCNGKGALNQHLFKVTSDKYPKWFYYLWTLHYLPEFKEIASSKATTMGHIQRQHLSEAMVLVPDENKLKEMNSIISPIIDQIIVNKTEAQNLVLLRDTLLPKLMSGEIEF